MRKKTLTAALGAVCLSISVTACGALDKDSDKRPPDALPPTESPTFTDWPKAGDTEATTSASHIANVRTKSGSQQTYKSSTVVEYDGQLAVTMDTQLRVSDLAMRLVTTTYPVAFQAMGLPAKDKRTSESLMLPPVLYAKDTPPVFPGDKPWTKSTTETPATTATPTPGGKEPGQKDGLFAGLDKLRDAGDIHVVGAEAVNGVQTIHYAGTVSLVKLLEDARITPEQREQQRALYQALDLDGTTIDVWIGLDDLPVQLVTVAPVKFSKPVLQKTTSTFTDWDKPIDLTPPPADQVQDLGTLPPIPTGKPTPRTTGTAG